MRRATPEDLERWRNALYAGDQLDASVSRRLIAEVEQLREELAGARVSFAKRAAAALEKRLADVAAFNRGGCGKCGDAEARAFLAKLQASPAPGPRPDLGEVVSYQTGPPRSLRSVPLH